LGGGAYGIVSLVIYKPTGQKMAMKVLRTFDKKVFQKEFLPLVNLSHRNIVKLIGETRVFDFRAIIMEFMEGGNLGKGESFSLLLKMNFFLILFFHLLNI